MPGECIYKANVNFDEKALDVKISKPGTDSTTRNKAPKKSAVSRHTTKQRSIVHNDIQSRRFSKHARY